MLERDNLGSMDWPSTGSSLLPTDGNARRDEVLERPESLHSGFSCSEVPKTIADPAFPGHVVSDEDPETWLLNTTPNAPPSPITSEHRVDISLTLESEEVTHSARQDCGSVTNASMSLTSRDHVSERPFHLPPPPRITNLALPVFPRIALPRFSLPPAGINKMLEHQLASSVSRNDYDDTEIGSAAPDHLVSLLSSAQNGEIQSGNVSQ